MHQACLDVIFPTSDSEFYVRTEDCAPHVDENLRVVNSQTCILSSCGGTCVNRYCIIGGSLDQTQVLCILNNLYFIIGASIVVSLLVIASAIACCCKMCLLATATNVTGL
ncbi:unnamed protein product [Ranitomeya imitator]|uniref:Shisa N-terminal domain-containing protein n=1 Tax=Ranitomeya imitator TaxID=111125 RepID=A0ABN9L9N3_9NEOB|nr:unnamed protein product [Ranitomeya imitator]